jgi:DNA-binding MarR family transcriptional regulator
MSSSEKEIEILENIYNSPEKIRQRDLAHIVGLSLGMTNAILKRLAKKGLITISKVNNRNIQYAVSPEGMEEIARRSYRYFKRTIKNIAYYKESIETLIAEVARNGYEAVAMVGPSDLDFIVEHLCFKYGLEFKRRKEKHEHPDWFFLYSENLNRTREPVPEEDSSAENDAWLVDIVVGM